MINGTFIVTGATGGIGGAIVRGLIERGVRHVILACRNADKCMRLIDSIGSCGARLEFMHLDLESFSSVKRFAADCAARRISVSALFNNAGTMPADARLTENGYESATQVNFLSAGMLTELLLPLMPCGASVVFTTSMTRHIASLRSDWLSWAMTHHGRFTTYGRSKLMLTHYALDLSRRLEGMGITVNCSDPGVVDSAIITMGNPVVDRLADMIVRPIISTPAQGAKPALDAAGSGLTGQIFTLMGHAPIPERYLSQPLHSLPRSVIHSLTSLMK